MRDTFQIFEELELDSVDIGDDEIPDDAPSL